MQSKTPDVVSLCVLPDRFRCLFPYEILNHIQSKAFPYVFYSDQNYVLSAPTGSGKTTIFELAICRLVSQFPVDGFKVIYLAPTKSLCSERFCDWQSRFRILNLNCVEYTGDDTGSWKLGRANVIISTPEKWDAVTRKWKDNESVIKLVKLFLIDEVHVLKEMRGATLEALVSRMRRCHAHIRFVAMSTNIPNVKDIAEWLHHLEPNGAPAKYDAFGDEYRPVQLQKFVYGVASHCNEFAVDRACDAKLLDVIKRHGARRPTIIFCMTRKISMNTAKLMCDEWTVTDPPLRPWPCPSHPISDVDDAMLRGEVAGKECFESLMSYVVCMSAGVAFHHAGLSANDRRLVESEFRKGEISVICCTSTLAVGVNLPCHLVIIKNTLCWASDGYRELQEMEITQMIGRAGRPQFDTSAVAVILTRQEKVHAYQRLVSGRELVESSLHLQLLEHMNFEVSLGFITTHSMAKQWIEGTFLAVRLRKDPTEYAIEGAKPGHLSGARMIDDICTATIARLRESGLLEGNTSFSATEFGHIMARYGIKLESMKRIMRLKTDPGMHDMLLVAAEAEEFNEIKWRNNERKLYEYLNAAPGIKFPLDNSPTAAAHKVYILVQSVLGDIGLPSTSDFRYSRQQYETDQKLAFVALDRLVRCITDCQITRRSGKGVRNSLELARSISAKAWDGSPTQMRQLHGVGPAAIKKFIGANILSIQDLVAVGPHQINVIMNRNPGFGESLMQRINDMPMMALCLRETKQKAQFENLELTFTAKIAFLNPKSPETFNQKPLHVCFVAERSDGYLIDFRRMTARFAAQNLLYVSATLTNHHQKIYCQVMCDEVAGSLRSAELRPKLTSERPALLYTAQEQSRLNQNISNHDSENRRPRYIRERRIHKNLETGETFNYNPHEQVLDRQDKLDDESLRPQRRKRYVFFDPDESDETSLFSKRVKIDDWTLKGSQSFDSSSAPSKQSDLPNPAAGLSKRLVHLYPEVWGNPKHTSNSHIPEEEADEDVEFRSRFFPYRSKVYAYRGDWCNSSTAKNGNNKIIEVRGPNVSVEPFHPNSSEQGS